MTREDLRIRKSEIEGNLELLNEVKDELEFQGERLNNGIQDLNKRIEKQYAVLKNIKELLK